jgi:hypothetical protein
LIEVNPWLFIGLVAATLWAMERALLDLVRWLSKHWPKSPEKPTIHLP